MNETPQERLDYYVSGHIDLVRKLGGEVDGSAAAKGIAAILEIADRGAPGVRDDAGEKNPADVLESKRLQGPEALAEATGGEFFYGDEREEPLVSVPKAPPPLPSGTDGERHITLLGRLGMLMAKIPGVRATPESPDAEFQFPRFARLLERTTSHAALVEPIPMPGEHSHAYAARRQYWWATGGKGVYARMALPERQRRYYRRLEQICDQSNAVIGRGWWVPK